jgi:GntR family transcriptional regulator
VEEAMSPGNKVEVLVDVLKASIQRGEYGVGGRLPSITDFAREHQMSRSTAYQIMSVLQNEGLVIKRGESFYANYRMRVTTSVVPPFEEVLAKHDAPSPFARNIIEPEIIGMPDHIAQMFGQPTGLHVVHRYRVQGQGDLPYRLSEYWFPENLARPYLQQLKDDPGYDILEDIKSDLEIMSQTVHDDVLSRLPTKDEATLLQISRNITVQEVRRTNRTPEGQVLMHHLIVFVGPLSMLSYDYEIKNRLPLKKRP